MHYGHYGMYYGLGYSMRDRDAQYNQVHGVAPGATLSSRQKWPH
jgi:hypothetical protein